MKRLIVFALLGLAVAARAGRADEEQDAELARLRARVKQLEAENRALRDEVARLKGLQAQGAAAAILKAPVDDLRRLAKLYEAFQAAPENAQVRRALADQAKRLARQYPTRLVWDALIKTGTLKDGMSLREAEKLLGPPTNQSPKQVGWYFNPLNMHVAPYLYAKRTSDGLSGWAIVNH